MRRLALAVALAVGPFVLASGARAGGGPEKGRELANKYCSRCHVVGDDPFAGIDSTPSFRFLTKLSDYVVRLQTFYQRSPHPVFVKVPGVPRRTEIPPFIVPFTVSPDNIEDIIAFVKTLEGK